MDASSPADAADAAGSYERSVSRESSVHGARLDVMAQCAPLGRRVSGSCSASAPELRIDRQAMGDSLPPNGLPGVDCGAVNEAPDGVLVRLTARVVCER